MELQASNLNMLLVSQLHLEGDLHLLCLDDNELIGWCGSQIGEPFVKHEGTPQELWALCVDVISLDLKVECQVHLLKVGIPRDVGFF